MSRLPPVAIAPNHSSEMHLIYAMKDIPRIHSPPPCAPGPARLCAASDGPAVRVRCVGHASRCRLLRQLTRTDHPREPTQQEWAISSRSGPPATLRFCADGPGVIWELPSRLNAAGRCPGQVPRYPHSKFGTVPCLLSKQYLARTASRSQAS